jgi:hypothetical protein
MSALALIEQIRAAGITIRAEEGLLRYQGQKDAIARLLPELKAHKAELLAALRGNGDDSPRLLTEACRGIEIRPGEPFTVETFRSLLSADDVADIEAGHYLPITLWAYAESMAAGIASGRLSVSPKAERGIGR